MKGLTHTFKLVLAGLLALFLVGCGGIQLTTPTDGLGVGLEACGESPDFLESHLESVKDKEVCVNAAIGVSTRDVEPEPPTQ